MKKIAVITATRAEFGLLKLLIETLRKYETDDLKVELIVTGTHLSEAYGNTINEIIQAGLRIDEKIYISVDSNSSLDIAKNQAETLVKFAELFQIKKYKGIVILGDRYEMMSVAMAASNTHTPIFHLCGGDTTEGAMDEWIRHSITKMSYLHFVTNEDSRRRVIQLGEAPDRVFNYGSPGIDNILNIDFMSKEDALKSIGLTDCSYALCTYHPVTMENEGVDKQMEFFLEAIEHFPEIKFIVTKSNADRGGARINTILDDVAKEIGNLFVYTSLGLKRYLSLMRYAEFVLGNSSSGLYEAPSFHIPTVNIGDRQRGRLKADSIIDCTFDRDSIVKAIEKSLSKEFKDKCALTINPYGDGKTVDKITNKIIEILGKGNIDLKKKFYDL